jgi:hypothetical protein
VKIITFKELKQKLMRLVSIGTSQMVHRRQVLADIAFHGVSTGASGASSAVISYPASITAGMGLFMVVGSKLQAPRADTPAGWRRIKETLTWFGSNGSDQGAIRGTVFFKEATGTENSGAGTVTVTVDGATSVLALVYAFTKDPRAYWNIDVHQGHYNTYGNPNYTIRCHDSIVTQTGDILFCPNVVNTDNYSWGSQALTHTGAGITTLNAELAESSTSLGNDQEQFASLFKVTSGAGSGQPIFTALSSGSQLELVTLLN